MRNFWMCLLALAPPAPSAGAIAANPLPRGRTNHNLLGFIRLFPTCLVILRLHHASGEASDDRGPSLPRDTWSLVGVHSS